MADRSGDERWEVVRTAEFDRWLRATSEARRENVTGAMERLANMGPTLGRPRVDSIKGSRVHDLKELRLHDGVRVLFAFDPNRRAVMLVGGTEPAAGTAGTGK